MTGDDGDSDSFRGLTSPIVGERGGDNSVPGIPVGITLVDAAGQTYTFGTASVDSVRDDSANLSLSPITGSSTDPATPTLSGPAGNDEASAAGGSSGWWDIPIAVSSDPSLDTSATFVVQEDGATRFAALSSLTLTTSSTGSAGGSLAPSLPVGSDISALVVVAPSDGGSLAVGSGAGSSAAEAAAAAISPTVSIIGSPVEGTTLTASAVVTGGFTGSTVFHWQRFYAGSWFNIPVQLSPYSPGEIITFVTTPTYVVREEDENVAAIRVEAAFVDGSGVTQATVDSPSTGPVLDEPATLSLSSIAGSPVVGATLTVSGLVTTDDFTGAPAFNWQRFYSGGWWDIPVQLSPYSSGEVLTYVTTPTYVVRAEDADVLAIRVEGTYIDDTGQTFTAFSDLGRGVTIVQPPRLTAADAFLGEDEASVALAITDAARDSQYTLGNVTISGVPADWSLSGDGAASIAAGTWTVGSGGLGSLVLVAPSAGIFTLGVTASESAAGPTGVLTATATTSFAVTVIELPIFSGPTSFSVLEAVTVPLAGIGVTALDSDDTLGATATLSGLPSGWTLFDGTAALAATGRVVTLPTADLGALAIETADNGSESGTLTLTVTSSEHGTTATGSAALTISATGQAELPTFGTATRWSGNPSGITLSGLSATSDDSDDTLSATLTGLAPGWRVVDPHSGSSFTSTSITGIPVADLGSLVVIAPTSATSASDVLTLTVGSSEGGNTTYASEVLTVVASSGGAPPADDSVTLSVIAGAASAENTSFATGVTGTLKLDHSAAFTGAISGLAAGDSIDLADLAFGSNLALSYTDNGTGGGTLTVDNGAKVVDLALLGQYAAAGFRAQSDPGGGTLITYSPQASATEVASLTNPSHQP